MTPSVVTNTATLPPSPSISYKSSLTLFVVNCGGWLVCVKATQQPKRNRAPAKMRATVVRFIGGIISQLQSSHMTPLRTTCVLLSLAFSLAAQKQPFDVQALLKIARISEPQLSPDGKTVAFTVQTIDLEQNTKPKQIYTVPTAGGSPHQVTP